MTKQRTYISTSKSTRNKNNNNNNNDNDNNYTTANPNLLKSRQVGLTLND